MWNQIWQNPKQGSTWLYSVLCSISEVSSSKVCWSMLTHLDSLRTATNTTTSICSGAFFLSHDLSGYIPMGELCSNFSRCNLGNGEITNKGLKLSYVILRLRFVRSFSISDVTLSKARLSEHGLVASWSKIEQIGTTEYYIKVTVVSFSFLGSTYSGKISPNYFSEHISQYMFRVPATDN